MDECIDIPKCDFIFITYACESKIKNIQRLSRPNRIDESNPYKVSLINIWVDEYTDKSKCDKYEENEYDVLNKIIVGIREYDFNKKFKELKEFMEEENNNKIPSGNYWFWK